MRPSLNQFERVESYVMGTLPVQERLAFEAELLENPDLQNMVDFQQQVVRAVNRQALRADIALVSSQFGQGGGSGGHFPWKWIFSSFAVLATGVVAWFALSTNSVERQQAEASVPTPSDAPVSLVSNETAAAPAVNNSYSPFKKLFPMAVAQSMKQSAEQMMGADPVHRTNYLEPVDFKELDFLPPGFFDKVAEGMPFKTHRDADRELCDSIYYTLSSFTRSASKFTPYAAGGIRYMNVLMEKSKGFLAGDKVIRGSIVTENHLATPWGATVTVLMNGKSSRKTIRVNRWGYFRFSKAEVGEAIIYFQSNWYKSDTQHVTIRANGPKVTRLKPFVLERLEEPKTGGEYELAAHRTDCSIDPLSIKVIRGSAFQQTYLATYAFEQRLAKLHAQPNGQELLEVYIANASKDLYKVDSIVATRVKTGDKAIFVAFSNERLTNVKDRPNEKQLFAAYTSKFKDAASKQQELERSYCRTVNKQIEQLESKIQKQSVAVSKKVSVSAAQNNNEIYSPKTSSMSKSETTLAKLETRLDELVERSEAEDAFLQELREFIGLCEKEVGSKISVD